MNDTTTLPPQSPPPYHPYQQQPPPELPPAARGRRRAGFAAAVVATSLVVGGAAGVGGAAAWNAFQDEPALTTTTQERTTSQVASSSDSPAAEGSVEAVAAKVLPSVVEIDVTGAQGAGSGSGIILSSDGQILTNNHVVELAESGGSLRVAFNDGSTAPAEILGTDPLTDTALIQAQDVSGLTPATIGKSGDIDVGQGVVAVGSPFGLQSTVTSGIVSALDRPVNVGSDGQGSSTVYPAIQTDAAINPGNSGGPLVDLAGNVVGVNASIRTTSTGSESGSIGLGFAIPIDEVMPIVDQMANGETPTHARLGVTVSDVGATGQPGAPTTDATEGAVVREVQGGSTAANAGLEQGDVITKVDDHRIASSDALVAIVRSYRPGDEVTVTYVRGGDEQTATLTLDSDASSS